MKDRDNEFLTRGIVLTPQDLDTWSWTEQAAKAGLTTVSVHCSPEKAVDYIKGEKGAAFLESCTRLGLKAEYELHAMSSLLPRGLFERDRTMFRMDGKGNRVSDANLCIHSEAALEVVCENAIRFSKLLKPATGRHFLWIDDGKPMCACPKCRELSDSDQALILENAMIRALRGHDPAATLCHLAYLNTTKAPSKVKPEKGIFLEYAPFFRRYDRPISDREARYEGTPSPSLFPLGRPFRHGELTDILDENLEWFGKEDAQILDYWLDLSFFTLWKRESLKPLPWHGDVFLKDLEFYKGRGLRHITSFGVYLDGVYVSRFGEPPVMEYGRGLKSLGGR